MWGGAPGRAWAGPGGLAGVLGGAWGLRRRWVGSSLAPGRNQCISCLPRDGRVDWLRFLRSEQIPGPVKSSDWGCWVPRPGAARGSGQSHQGTTVDCQCCACCSPDFLEPLAFKAGRTTARWSFYPAGHPVVRPVLPPGGVPWCVLSVVTDVGMWADGRRWAATLGREEESCAEGVGAMQGQGLCLRRCQVVPGLPDSGLFLLQEMK